METEFSDLGFRNLFDVILSIWIDGRKIFARSYIPNNLLKESGCLLKHRSGKYMNIKEK